MTDREEQAVILVQGTNHAIRAEKLLQRAGISCKLIPVPRHLSSDCGVCVRVERADREAASQALEEARLAVEGIYEV